MLKVQSNPNYKTLTRVYDTMSAGYTGYYSPGLNIKPQSYFLHDIIDITHFKNAHPTNQGHYQANDRYPWKYPQYYRHQERLYTQQDIDSGNIFDTPTGYGKEEPYKPFRQYKLIKKESCNPFTGDINITNTLEKKPDNLASDDIQCILGMRIIDINNTKDKYYPKNHLYYHSNLTSSLIGAFGRIENNTVLSVVYITRKDGKINHDIYYSWCKETRLAFPEDLKHTTLENDIALSDKRMDKSIKSKHDTLSVIDSIRNKKEYIWYLPVDKWLTEKNGHTFSRPHKSSYKRPKTISTWQKRRTAKRKENRRYA